MLQIGSTKTDGRTMASKKAAAKPASWRLNVATECNPLKQALQFSELIATGQADSQIELASLSGIPRSTISAYLRLLDLDPDIKSGVLSLDSSDDRLTCLTEARLRPILSLQDPEERKAKFRELLNPSALSKDSTEDT